MPEPARPERRGAAADSRFALPRAGSVVFDCDSTLVSIEGIDHLAHAHRTEIRQLTRQAMDGAVPLEHVYGQRLALVRPSRAQVAALARAYVEAIVPDARDVVAALRAEGTVVRIISGGLLPAVRELARSLGLADDAVAAVDVWFDAAGEFAGFDENSPLARSGGKREVLEAWRSALPAPRWFVGDGMTDLEAKPAVDVFVVFAGVVERAAVAAAAELVIRCTSLAPLLPLALGGRPPRLAAARATFEKGLQWLESHGLLGIGPEIERTGISAPPGALARSEGRPQQ
jgi:phosphoserine phosphatase